MHNLKYILSSILLILAIPSANAVTVDGDLSDWGPEGFLTKDWSTNDTWVPNMGVQFIVEDNYNPEYGGDYTGVHIKGSGSNYNFYHEPRVTHKNGNVVREPFGGEAFDLEAAYFQQDDEFVYMLIVTSLEPDGLGDHRPGAVRIDIDKAKESGDGYIHELGVKVASTGQLEQFGIYEVIDWAETPDYVPSNLPSRILNGNLVDRAKGVYEACDRCNDETGEDFGKKIFIIELAIPKEALGVSSGTPISYGIFSITDNCTNDIVKIPEFMLIAVPLATILGLIFVLRMRRKEH